jgi:branched-chain amino acid transport system ATP-binding protein
MQIEEQEAVSILGRNGVGKTTTMRTIMGLTPPSYGQIVIKGQATSKWPPHRISKHGVAYVPAERDIFPGLNVEENLQIAARGNKENGGWTLKSIYEQFPLLNERRGQDGSTLSGGEQQILAIARALLNNPSIIMLDEPSQGLSPFMVEKVADIILYCIACGITLLVVEQNYHLALKIANRHYLMTNKGIVSKVATSQELIDDPEILQNHLSV